MKLHPEQKSKSAVLFDFINQEDFEKAKSARGETVDPDDYCVASMMLVSAKKLAEAGITVPRTAPVDIPDDVVCEWAKIGAEIDSATIWLEVK